MESKLKVLLLGKDAKLLEKTRDRLVSSYPLDIIQFTDIKDFLDQCIQEQPDIVGISFNYPHKNITQFPRIIEMAVNTPVIVFSEDRDNKVVQNIMLAKTPYKITGGMTAQNMWVQISKFIKSKEANEEYQKISDSENRDLNEANNNSYSQGPSGFTNTDRQTSEGEKSNINKNNTVFLKGEAREKSKQEKSNILNSLFKSLNEASESELKNQGETHITSSDASAIKNSGVNHVNTVDMKGLFDDEDVGIGESSGERLSDTQNNSIQSNTKSGELISKPEKEEQNKKSNNVVDINKKPNVSGIKKASKQSQYPASEDSDEMNQNSHEDGANKYKNNFSQQKKEKIDKKKESKDNVNHEEKGPKSKSLATGIDVEKIRKEEANTTNNNEENIGEEKESVEKIKKETSDFGSIKLADEKEVKEIARNKEKKKKKEDSAQKKNLLMESCDLALRKCFLSKKVDSSWTFESIMISVFIVELLNYKGFLMLANSFKNDLDPSVSEEFRAVIIDNFKKNKVDIKISHPCAIRATSVDYPELVQSFCDFTIGHEEENGRQQVVSFMPREVVKPKVDLSEKEGMYSIDIKTIPPQTKVNFDAFLYLPKNQRFVRYLKDGRSLSLEQAKRQSEILQNSKLYLPKEQKQKFIEFFVQNSIDWEIAINKKKIAI